MVKNKSTLPEYENPPVIETVLSVQFNPLPNFSLLHYGLYWETIRGTYPKQSVKLPLEPIIETFGTQTDSTPSIGLELRSSPEVRTWFIDQSESKLIQLQSNRFIVNWRKVTGKEVYPRYKSLKPAFKKEWDNFCSFLNGQGLDSPTINQCEVTYINHFEIGKEIDSYGAVYEVLACHTDKYSTGFLSDPEIVRLNTSYVMTDNRGRLHVNLSPVIKKRDAQKALQLELTARGNPSSSDIEAVLDWFDLGHDWIVRGFTDLTTVKMHKLWGLTS